MKKLLLIPAFACSFIACNNDKKTETTETSKDTTSTTSTTSNTTSTGDNKIVFTVDGKLVETTGWNIGFFDLGSGKSINVTSNMNEEPRTVNFNINGDKPGTYPISSAINAQKPGISYGNYRPDYNKDMTNVYSFESGEFVIQSIDLAGKLLNGTFHGVAKNGNGESVTITDGKVINGTLKL